MADRIRGAKLVELPGDDHLPWVGDQDEILDEVEGFLTGVRRGADPDRVLATVLFTDVVRSTEHAVELGDKRWSDLLASHHAPCDASCRTGGGRRSTPPATAFSRRSTVLPERFAVRAPRVMQYASSGSRFGPGSTRGSTRSSEPRSLASPCTQVHGSRRLPVQVRFSSRAPSKISWPDRGSSSRIVESTSSKAYRIAGACIARWAEVTGRRGRAVAKATTGARTRGGLRYRRVERRVGVSGCKESAPSVRRLAIERRAEAPVRNRRNWHNGASRARSWVPFSSSV